MHDSGTNDSRITHFQTPEIVLEQLNDNKNLSDITKMYEFFIYTKFLHFHFNSIPLQIQMDF